MNDGSRASECTSDAAQHGSTKPFLRAQCQGDCKLSIWPGILGGGTRVIDYFNPIFSNNGDDLPPLAFHSPTLVRELKRYQVSTLERSRKHLHSNGNGAQYTLYPLSSSHLFARRTNTVGRGILGFGSH